MEKFILGVAVGLAGGAVLVANNYKLRALVRKNQDEIMRKAESYIDEKLEGADCGCGGKTEKESAAKEGASKEPSTAKKSRSTD